MAKEKLNDGTLLGTLHDENYNLLKDRVEEQVAKKIHSKIESKKEAIIKDAIGE